MKTPEELRNEAVKLEKQAADLRMQAHVIHLEQLQQQPALDRLVFAATSRCPCGAGLAYDPCHDDKESPLKGPSYWDCSAILLGTADPKVKHTDKLPFAFYEIKSEGQPSACGRTTRPK